MKVRMKKRLSCITAAIMACLLSGILTAVPVQAASSDFVILNYTNISDTSIVKGDAFTVDVSYQNVSGSTLNNVSVTIDSTCSFYGSSSNTVEAYNPDSGGIRTKTLALIYKGTGNELMLVYSYTKGGVDYSTSQSVFISGCTATTTDTTTIDTTKYTASLGVVAETEIPVLTAGKSNTLKLPILNSGNYAAKDLSILMEQSDTSKGSIIEKINLTQFILLIKPDESQTASFTFNVPGDAPSGIQVMKLTYKYVNTYGDALTASEFIQVKVVNTSTPPRLSVFNTTTFADPQESGVIVLNIGVRNMGTRAAEDVKVTLKGLKNGGFTTFNSTDVKYVAEIKGGSDSGVNYRLSVPTSETNAGNSDLTIKLDYTDEKGTAYNDESVIFLPYNGNGELVETGKPQLSCTITAQPQNAVSANRDFKVSMNLTNSGLAAAKNIKVTLSCDKEIVTKSLSTVSVDKIDKGTTKSLDFVMFATQDAITKNYPVAINIEYEDSKGTKFNASQYIGIYVENVASSSTKTVPRIIVSNYSMDPVDIKAGSDFKLTASFLNTSKKMAVSNIKVSISSDDGTFTPVDSGNAFFIEYIGIKESVEKSLMLHAKADAEQKSYVLTVNFDYEDEQGNPYTSKETISVPVLQNPRLVTGDFSLPAETMAGQPMQVYLDFYNMGKTTLNNLMIKAVGDFTGEGLSYYVGNFGSGSSESFDVSIIPNNVGELKGSVVFTYEDATGKPQSVSKDFSVNVIEMQMDPGIVDGGNVMVGPDGLPIGTQPETGLKKYLWYGVAGVVVIAGLVTFLIIRKKRKKRKEMLLDE